MLTPEDLKKIDTSKLVKIYEQLNTDLTVDLIKQLEKTDKLNSATKHELKTLIKTNGKELFDKAIEKIGTIDKDVLKEIKKTYNEMIDKDFEAYEELFEYRGKKFVLAKSQIKILNTAINQTNKELKNFTKTVAFKLETDYVDAVDRAYFDVVSGGMDYNTAIKNAVDELSEKGVTLKDKAGRNVKLETAVKRNVLMGVKLTADMINKELDEYLGCDGYEVTAHIGARPTHAEAQGKIYAKTKEDAIKYGVEWWGDVEDLWQEPNCRHTYFGVILDIVKPSYTKRELRQMENLTVNYKGKNISYYDATQIKNRLERSKKELNTQNKVLKLSNEDNLEVYAKLKKERSKLKDLNTEMKKAEDKVYK